MTLQDDEDDRHEVSRRREIEWHLDRRVSIGLILTVLAQAALGVWYTSSLEDHVDYLQKGYDVLQAARERQDIKLEIIGQTLARIDERLSILIGDADRDHMKNQRYQPQGDQK